MQPELLGFEGLGFTEETLPDGVSRLDARQVNFVRHLLDCGQQGKAALRAGYGNGNIEAASVEAVRQLRKPEVLSFYQKCLGPYAQESQQILKRTVERAATAHDRWREAAEKVTELEQTLLYNNGEPLPDREQVALTIAQEKRLDTFRALERSYAADARKEDSLLAAQLGKLKVNVDLDEGGEATLVLSPRQIESLGTIRQEAIAAGGRN